MCISYTITHPSCGCTDAPLFEPCDTAISTGTCDLPTEEILIGGGDSDSYSDSDKDSEDGGSEESDGGVKIRSERICAACAEKLEESVRLLFEALRRDGVKVCSRGGEQRFEGWSDWS